MGAALGATAFRPSQVYYLISFRCNQRCSKCRHWDKSQDGPVLEPDLMVNALRALAPVDEFCIVGGEPLLHAESILSILASTQHLTHRTVIVTNGVLLSPKLVDEFAQYNIHLVVSVDTLDRDFWRYVRGMDSYDCVMRNLEYACEVLSPGQLSIQSVRAKETEPYLDAVGKYCRERGLHHSIQDYVQDGFDGEWTACSIDKPTASSAGHAEVCFAADRNLSIDPDGNVSTCFQQYLIPGCAEPLGNIKRDPMQQILTSGYAQQVQEAMRGCSLPCRVLKCNLES